MTAETKVEDNAVETTSSIPHFCIICGGPTHIGIGPLNGILSYICEDPDCGFEEPIPE